MTVSEEAPEEPNDNSMSDFSFKADSNDVVISGMSCRLPDADNMAEFRNILSHSDKGMCHYIEQTYTCMYC